MFHNLSYDSIICFIIIFIHYSAKTGIVINLKMLGIMLLELANWRFDLKTFEGKDTSR